MLMSLLCVGGIALAVLVLKVMIRYHELKAEDERRWAAFESVLVIDNQK